MDILTIQRTPWGTVQYRELVADGIVRVHTAGHGGLVLSDARLRAMPTQFKLNAYGTGRYFEEDCEWALVVLAFPDEFTQQQRDDAQETANRYYPTLREVPA